MPEKKTEKQFVELWPGEKVEVTRMELLHDFDYIRELQQKMLKNDIEFVEMLFVLIGGEETFNKLREHTIAEKGVFDIDSVGKVTEQLLELIPKASSPSTKRW